MKKIAVIMILGLFLASLAAYPQIGTDLKRKADKSTDEAIDGFFGKKKKKDKESEQDQPEQNKDQEEVPKEDKSVVTSNPEPQKENELKWSKYDFVPGTNVIFEDDLSAEENGEFPSRWDINEGNVENAQLGGENVIMFRAYSEIIPWIENSSEDYLPDVFTFEFDCYFTRDRNGEYYYLYFLDRKNQEYISGMPRATIYWNRIILGDFSSYYPNISNRSQSEIEGWRHISVAFNKRSMKIYLDDTRLVNVPNLEAKPTGITIAANIHKDNYSYIRNIRIAEGGLKLYQKFQEDGKIVATGIRFETGKWTIKPESMGIINEVYEMLDEYPDIRLSIEGHTDNVGDETSNKELSEKRAEAVMNLLVKMGIDQDRLSSSGYGESMPAAENNTAEGKANNRRVEFVEVKDQ